MSRRRDLSDDDAVLWSSFSRSIKPLRVSPKSDGPAPKPLAAPSTLAPPKPKPRPITARDIPPAPPPALAPLGRRLKQRVARGREPIDARLDLHGMTQAEAHAELLHFLHRAQAKGARTVLVVTGKGSRRRESDGAREHGVLRRQVPLWLALPEFRRLIVAFDDAHVGHGGEGALYLRLRRDRG